MTDGRVPRPTRASSIRRGFAAIAAVAALSGVAAACADDESGDGGVGGEGSTATTTVGSGGSDTVDPPEETPVDSSTTVPSSARVNVTQISGTGSAGVVDRGCAASGSTPPWLPS